MNLFLSSPRIRPLAATIAGRTHRKSRSPRQGYAQYTEHTPAIAEDQEFALRGKS